MIIGTGIDIIEINRVEKAVSKAGFREKVFSEAEQEYCDGRGKQGRASYAGRWAAKEAICKAIGCGISGGRLNELEIIPTTDGRPVVKLGEDWKLLLPAEAKIHITISHSRDYAIAQCVIENNNQ